MKRFIKTALTAVLAVAAVACTRDLEPLKENINGTIDLSFTGVINGYASQEETKAEAQTVVRIMWNGNETVYVYDGTKKLGFLTASIEGTDGTYAKLSGTISETTATTLTFVYSPQFSETQARAVTEGKISLDLSTQNGEEVPFLIYATLPTAQTQDPTSFTNDVVQFNLATSVFKCNCTGLSEDGDVSKAEISGVNTKCELALSDNGAPEVSGSTPGTITRTAGFTKADQRAIFSVALPKTAASTKRTLLVHQDSKVYGAPFSAIALAVNKSYNTVYQLGEYVPNESGGYAPAVKVKGVTLNKNNTEIEAGATENLVATVTPADATHKEVIWSSSDEAVATVVATTGEVTGVAEGSAVITATTADGNFTAVCLVTVKPVEPEFVVMKMGSNQSKELKWATMNLGATTIATSYTTCYGDLYQWGSVNTLYDGFPYTSATAGNFTGKWKSGVTGGFVAGNREYTDTAATLPDANDVVKQKYPGTKWRMPTSQEFMDLADACGGKSSYNKSTNPSGASTSLANIGIYWCTNYDGVAGCLFYDGTNRLFFPAAGYVDGTTLYNAGSFGTYWSSSLGSPHSYDGRYLYFDSQSVDPQANRYRYSGFPVRPVSD